MPIRRLGDPRSAPGRVGLKWLPQIVRGQRVPGRTRCTVFANPRAPVVPNRFEGGTGVGAMFGSSHTEPFRRYDWSPNGMFHKELFQQKRYTPECMKHGPRSNGTPGTRNKTGFPLQTSGFQGLMLVFSGVPHCNEHTCFFSKHWGGNMSNEHMFQTLVCVCVALWFRNIFEQNLMHIFPSTPPLKRAAAMFENDMLASCLRRNRLVGISTDESHTGSQPLHAPTALTPTSGTSTDRPDRRRQCICHMEWLVTTSILVGRPHPTTAICCWLFRRVRLWRSRRRIGRGAKRLANPMAQG